MNHIDPAGSEKKAEATVQNTAQKTVQQIAVKQLPVTETEQGWIGWLFFTDLFTALRLTLKYMFSKSVTMQYPDKEKWQPYSRFRGHHFLKKDEQGNTKCVACELCAKICPSKCIEVVPYEDENGNRHPEVFNIDLGRCLYCGLCEDACPVDAIAMGSDYEFAAYNSQDLLVHKEKLLTMPGKAETGGKVIAASLSDDAKTAVASEPEHAYHWWNLIHRKS